MNNTPRPTVPEALAYSAQLSCFGSVDNSTPDYAEQCILALSTEVMRLCAERDSLRADKERLDWLDANCADGMFDWFCHPRNVRAAIDAARKETKP